MSSEMIKTKLKVKILKQKISKYKNNKLQKM